MAFKNDNHDDLTKFKNRLWHLMIDKGLDTSQKLAIELFDNKLVTVNSKKDLDVFARKKSAISSIEHKINKHLNADDPKALQAEYAIAYSKFFNCSTDYLFGFSNIKSINPNVKNVCTYLNLSEKAITNIKKNSVKITNIDESITSNNILDLLLSSYKFPYFILELRNLDYLYYEMIHKKYELEQNTISDLGKDLFNKGLNLFEITEKEHFESNETYPKVDDSVLEARDAISLLIDEQYSLELEYENNLKVGKYTLFEYYIEIINDILNHR